MNYVRKLGFEETPDYDFLRELFTKVLRSNGDVDDGVYDWNLLNGIVKISFKCTSLLMSLGLDGAGWEASVVCLVILIMIRLVDVIR